MKFLFAQIKSKPVEYAILAIILVVSLIMLFVFRFDHHSQRRIIYVTAGLYFLWSLYHHYHRGDLQIGLVIEYLLFILLALVVLAATL